MPVVVTETKMMKMGKMEGRQGYVALSEGVLHHSRTLAARGDCRSHNRTADMVDKAEVHAGKAWVVGLTENRC